MNKKQRSALRRFRRVHEFLSTIQVEGTTVKVQVLNEVVREMSEGGEELDASSRLTRGEVARQRSLRDALWDRHMVPLSRIARRAFDVPGMDVQFLLPRKVADNQAILDAARGMTQAVEQHTERFVKQVGLPQNFVEQFRSAIDELEMALTARVQSERRRKTSGKTLGELVKRGIATVDVLDAIVKPRLSAKPDLLATWNNVKRPIEPGGGADVGLGEPDRVLVMKVA